MAFLRKPNETTFVVDEPIPTSESSLKSTTSTNSYNSSSSNSPKASPANTDADFPFLSMDDVEELRKRWESIQANFIDEPRDTVRQADELIGTTIKRVAESLSEARSNMEGQWTRGSNVSTEDLRIALKKYRSFFQKLMSV